MTQFDKLKVASLPTWVEAVSACRDAGLAHVVITLIEVDGHVPQMLGAKALVGASGLLWGTVGGGKIEARALELAQKLIAGGEDSPVLQRWDLQKDLGMTCGGAASLLFEIWRPNTWNVMIYGAGHVGQATAKVFASLNCNLTVVDHRLEFLEILPTRVRKVQVELDGYAKTAADALGGTMHLIMTRGHATDLPILAEVLRRGDAAYVGVIGSRVKGRALRAALLERGFTREQVHDFHTPMGLPVGTSQPAEIAISIAAQVLQVRDQLLGCSRRSVRCSAGAITSSVGQAF